MSSTGEILIGCTHITVSNGVVTIRALTEGDAKRTKSLMEQRQSGADDRLDMEASGRAIARSIAAGISAGMEPVPSGPLDTRTHEGEAA